MIVWIALLLWCLAAPALAQPPSTATVPPVIVESSRVLPYPATARQLGIEGTTVLRIRVVEDGQVGEVEVEHSAGHADLDQAAVDAARRWRFEPARRGEQAVAMWVRAPVRFALSAESRSALTVPKPTLVGDRLAFSSPPFSIAVPEGWRVATAADADRIEIYQRWIASVRNATKAGLQSTRAAPFSELVMATQNAMLWAQIKRATALTNGTGAYASVEVTDKASATRYPRLHHLSDHERAEIWKEFSGATRELRLLEVKDYPDSAGLVIVYTETGGPAPVIWMLVRFRSETSVVTFRHGATATNTMNGLDGFDTITKSFRFEKRP